MIVPMAVLRPVMPPISPVAFLDTSFTSA